MGKIKLFCIPYAGGSAMVYTKMKKNLAGSIELVPVELAGRGMRFEDGKYTCFNEVVDDVYDFISREIDGPFSILGHSMGCWVAYEVYYKILSKNNIIPEHLFLSGNRPPHIRKEEKKLSTLCDEEFKEEIYKLGGTPKELFLNNELCEMFLPILRMDYKAIGLMSIS